MADETKYERVDLPRELLDRARNMVAALRTQAPWLTLKSVLVEPASNHIAQLERAFNGGEPFPPRECALPPGRPPKLKAETPPLEAIEDETESAA